MAWRFNAVENRFDPAATLKGHTLAVVTLVVGANRLYSGSMDQSIKVSGRLVKRYACAPVISDSLYSLGIFSSQ